MLEAVSDFFEGGGAGTAFGGLREVRPQQLEMALRVAQILCRGGVLAVEAPTGTGKSAAYLVPLLLALSSSPGSRGVVATRTLHLQQRLYRTDLPVLAEALGIRLKVRMAMGRSNYPCRRLAAERGAEWPMEPGTCTAVEYSCPADECLRQSCPYYARGCALQQARRSWQNADLLVTNHHLLLTSILEPSWYGGEGLLPEFDHLVVDEAHRLPSTAFELSTCVIDPAVERERMRALFDAICARNGRLRKGVLPALRGEARARLASLADRMRRELDECLETLSDALSERLPQAEADGRTWCRLDERGWDSLRDAVMGLHRALECLCSGLEEHLDMTERVEEGGGGLLSLGAAAASLGRRCAFCLGDCGGSLFAWIESRPLGLRGLAAPVLKCSPSRMGEVLGTSLRNACDSVVLTSATLGAGPGGLEFFLDECGLRGAETLVLDSPYDLRARLRAWFVDDLPPPSVDGGYREALMRALAEIVENIDEGGILVLFTSRRSLAECAQRLRTREHLWDSRRLLIQDEGMSRNELLESMRSEASVLLGVDSFWEGVDLPGDSLCTVVVTRLPFPVPDTPEHQALSLSLGIGERDVFRRCSLPMALLKFRQGAGRLIRSSADRGVLIVLDSRAARKSYGRHFASALSPARADRGPLRSCVRAAAAFLRAWSVPDRAEPSRGV